MIVELTGCPYQPLGSYLKALAVLRLVTQADKGARGGWKGNYFALDSDFDEQRLVEFFLKEYKPTPAMAPWNGGSGFYPKDRKVGIAAIQSSKEDRFAPYRADLELAVCIVKEVGEDKDEDLRRTEILRRCRNELSNGCVEWLDAAIAIAADESRAFAPILGTGGNEGRLDYTNNFMENLHDLLIAPDKKAPVKDLLRHALFGDYSSGLQAVAIGQYDPGRAGGFNQGEKISASAVVNQWDAVLTLEGAVTWAGGIYRRQGASYRSFLCSPFTVRASAVGYASASANDEARAELWTPLWTKPARFREVQSLFREGRASVDGKPASNGIEFAQAAGMLGVDRGIRAFIRYSLLKRRGDSYIALPAGKFDVDYRSNADLVREMNPFVDAARRAAKGATGEAPATWQPLERGMNEAIFRALLHERSNLLIDVLAAFGAMHKWLLLRGLQANWRSSLSAKWLEQVWKTDKAEVRIATALAHIRSRNKDGVRFLENLDPHCKHEAWAGRNLAARMLATLRRRVLDEGQSDWSPFSSRVLAGPGDVAAFLEGCLDEQLIEDLTFALVQVEAPKGLRPPKWAKGIERWSSYCLLKQFFASRTHPSPNEAEDEPRFRPDLALIALLAAGREREAVEKALARMKIAGLRPVFRNGRDSENAERLGAALLIPVSWVDRMRDLVARAPEAEEEQIWEEN